MLRDMLIRHEGLELKVYVDSVGIETIGVGRNLVDVGITREEALYLLDHDITDTLADCRRVFYWFDDISQARQDVVANMVFNMGLRRFRGFKQTIRYIEMNQFDDASTEMLDSKWAGQVGNRATELSRMMADG
jgi:lysozyme